MPAQLNLTSVVLAGNVLLRAAITGVIIRHRLTRDPDVLSSYTTDRTDAIINPDGSFAGAPIIIDGLLYNAQYTIWIITDCGSCGSKKQIFTTKPPACVDLVAVIGTVTTIIDFIMIRIFYVRSAIYIPPPATPIIISGSPLQIVPPVLALTQPGDEARITAEGIIVAKPDKITHFFFSNIQAYLCQSVRFDRAYVIPPGMVIETSDKVTALDGAITWRVAGHFSSPASHDFTLVKMEPPFVSTVRVNGVRVPFGDVVINSPGAFFEDRNVDFPESNFGYGSTLLNIVRLTISNFPGPAGSAGVFEDDWSIGPDQYYTYIGGEIFIGHLNIESAIYDTTAGAYTLVINWIPNGNYTFNFTNGTANLSLDSQGRGYTLQSFTVTDPATQTLVGDIYTVKAKGADPVNIQFFIQASDDIITSTFADHYTQPAGFIVDSAVFGFPGNILGIPEGFFKVIGHYPGTGIFDFVFTLKH